VTDPHDVIIRPVVSEKSYSLIETGVYTFVVAPGSSKVQIRQAVEAIWPGVKVAKVNTLNRKGKTRRGPPQRDTGEASRHQARDRHPCPGRDRDLPGRVR
jgi:ribosomal protein L23